MPRSLRRNGRCSRRARRDPLEDRRAALRCADETRRSVRYTSSVSRLSSSVSRHFVNVRLWSLHPKYLDSRGLVALWREALLAQAVLRGQTKGYRHHPQLERFRDQHSPVGAIADYLRSVHAEAGVRGYEFAGEKISPSRTSGVLVVTRGQLMHEWDHLMAKLVVRDPQLRERLSSVRRPQSHPSFRIVPGGVASWERVGGP